MSEVNQDVGNSTSVRPLHEIFKVAREFYSSSKHDEGKSVYMCTALMEADIAGHLTNQEVACATDWTVLTLKSFTAMYDSGTSLASCVSEITGYDLFTETKYVRGMAYMAWDAMIDKLEHDYNERK